MSQTQTRTFNAPEVAVQPMTANLGRVSNVEPTYQSTKSQYGYYVTPIQIEALGAGKNHKLWLCFQPEWLKYTFNVNQLNGQKGNPLRVYSSNIISAPDEKAMGILQALSGSEENLSELCSMLDGIDIDPEENQEAYCAAVTETLTSFFNTYKPTFGYILQQKSEKTDEIYPDEHPKAGKNVWKRTKYFELKNDQPFFYATEKELKKQRKSAETSAKKLEKLREDMEASGEYAALPGGFKVTFDDDTMGVPF